MINVQTTHTLTEAFRLVPDPPPPHSLTIYWKPATINHQIALVVNDPKNRFQQPTEIVQNGQSPQNVGCSKSVQVDLGPKLLR